jgi:hypothetical protein
LQKAQRVRHPELQLQRPKQITSRLTIAVVSSRFIVRQVQPCEDTADSSRRKGSATRQAPQSPSMTMGGSLMLAGP